MLHDVFRCGHDLGHSGLVVGTEQSRSVSGDECLADVVPEFREFFRVELHAFGLVEDQGLAVVVLHDAGLDTASGSIGRCVHVRDKADSGDVPVYVGRDGGHQIAVLIHFHLLHSHGLKLFAELLQKSELFVGTGLALRVRVRCRVESHIPEKSVDDLFHCILTFYIISESCLPMTAIPAMTPMMDRW